MTDEALPWAVLDLDGTVADVRHRLHHLKHLPKDWDAFFDAATVDPLLPEGAAVAHRLAEDHRVAYLSGRPERTRRDTVAWLKKYGLPPGPLFLRRENDRRPSWMGKISQLRKLAADGGVEILVDDDPTVIKQARAVGFAVMVADWMPREDPETQQTLFDAQHTEGRT